MNDLVECPLCSNKLEFFLVNATWVTASPLNEDHCVLHHAKGNMIDPAIVALIRLTSLQNTLFTFADDLGIRSSMWVQDDVREQIPGIGRLPGVSFPGLQTTTIKITMSDSSVYEYQGRK